MLNLKKLSLVASLATLAYGTSALANDTQIAGAKGTLNNVDSAINNAVQEASRLFEQNNGKTMKKPYNLIQSGKNPYLKILRISRDYKVELKFAGNAKGGKNGAIPVAKSLLGTDIVLVPVYNRGDAQITTFECLTNADREVSQFMGSKSTKEYTASFIRDYSDNKYLSLCVYMKRKLVR